VIVSVDKKRGVALSLDHLNPPVASSGFSLYFSLKAIVPVAGTIAFKF
jgi:hypothetical protein